MSKITFYEFHRDDQPTPEQHMTRVGGLTRDVKHGMALALWRGSKGRGPRGQR